MIETEYFRVFVRINDDQEEEGLAFVVSVKVKRGIVQFEHKDGNATNYVLANILGWRTEDVDR